jgi:hypothetical protein
MSSSTFYPDPFITLEELNECLKGLPNPNLFNEDFYQILIKEWVEVSELEMLPADASAKVPVPRYAKFEKEQFVKDDQRWAKWVLSSKTRLLV